MVNSKASMEELYPFAAHYFGVKKYRMHYVDEGSGEPLVMIHGNPSWSFMYRDLIKAFRGDYRVIAPDHLGCGRSDKPLDFPYRLETHIDNLEALLLDLDLWNITLIMHDWGGAVGMGFAVRYPERIKRLVVMNTAAFASARIPWQLVICRLPWLGKKLILDSSFFCRSAMKYTVSNPLSPEVQAAYLEPYLRAEDRMALYRFVQDIPMGPEHPSFEVLLGIEHGLWMFRERPVAIAWGMRDWCFSKYFLERWLDVFPQARVLALKDAAHYLQEDNPEELIAFLRRFLLETAEPSLPHQP